MSTDCKTIQLVAGNVDFHNAQTLAAAVTERLKRNHELGCRGAVTAECECTNTTYTDLRPASLHPGFINGFSWLIEGRDQQGDGMTRDRFGCLNGNLQTFQRAWQSFLPRGSEIDKTVEAPFAITKVGDYVVSDDLRLCERIAKRQRQYNNRHDLSERAITGTDGCIEGTTPNGKSVFRLPVEGDGLRWRSGSRLVKVERVIDQANAELHRGRLSAGGYYIVPERSLTPDRALEGSSYRAVMMGRLYLKNRTEGTTCTTIESIAYLFCSQQKYLAAIAVQSETLHHAICMPGLYCAFRAYMEKVPPIKEEDEDCGSHKVGCYGGLPCHDLPMSSRAAQYHDHYDDTTENDGNQYGNISKEKPR